MLINFYFNSRPIVHSNCFYNKLYTFETCFYHILITFLDASYILSTDSTSKTAGSTNTYTDTTPTTKWASVVSGFSWTSIEEVSLFNSVLIVFGSKKVYFSISNYVTSNIDPKFRRSKETELQQKLDTELFGLSSDFRSFWQPVQRLKLFNIICNFYMTLPSGKDAAKRYEYFDLMFCGREGTGPAHEYRMNILSNLCSMAIQLPCYSLFDDVAIWFMKVYYCDF